MTREQYQSVGPGMDLQVLVATYGEPYEIKTLPPGIVEYHYIERVPLRPDYAEENHYYIIIQNGKVVSKRNTTSSSNVDVQFRNF